MGLGGATTTRKSKTDTAPMQGLLDALTRQSGNIEAQRDFMANPHNAVTPLTPDEQGAFQGIQDQQGKYDSFIAQALGLQGDAMTRAGRAPTQGDIDPYFNLYLDNVLNDTVENINESSDRTQRGIGDQAKFLSSFGGSRHAVAEAINNSETQKNIGQQSNLIKSQGFESALGKYLDSIRLRSDMAQTGLADTGEAQRQKYSDLAAREAIGISARGVADREQDNWRTDWNRMVDDPYKKAAGIAGLTSAYPVSTLTNTTTEQQKQSPLTQILGLVTAGAGMFTGNPMAAASGFASLAGGGGGGRGWAKGGPVKRFAFGGRVGNPDSQSYSSEVMNRTQNPFANILESGNAVSNDIGVPALGSGMESDLGLSPLTMSPLEDDQSIATGMAIAPEILKPPSRGGNAVARLMDQFKNPAARNPFGGRGQGVPSGFAKGGSVKSFAEGGSVFKNLLKDPDALIEIGLRIAGSNGDPIQAISEGILGYKQSKEKEEGNPLEQYLLQLKAQKMEEDMELNRMKFGETQEMNDAREAAIWSAIEGREGANADRDAARDQGFQQFLMKYEQDQEQFAAAEEGRNKRDNPPAPKYAGMDDVFSAADAIARGVDKDGEAITLDSEAEDAVLADLNRIKTSAFKNKDTDTASAAQAKAKAIESRRKRNKVKGIVDSALGAMPK